jgi:hypothetical protein
MRGQPLGEQKVVSSVMQTMVRSPGGATSSFGNSSSARLIRAASDEQSAICAIACDDAAKGRARSRMVGMKARSTG